MSPAKALIAERSDILPKGGGSEGHLSRPDGPPKLVFLDDKKGEAGANIAAVDNLPVNRILIIR